jgi:hypothetical protein
MKRGKGERKETKKDRINTVDLGVLVRNTQIPIQQKQLARLKIHIEAI